MMTGKTIDIAVVRQLSNPADINRLLIEANALERSIDADLESLLASKTVVDDVLISLKTETESSLATAKAGAEKLCKSTSDTASLANKVSQKVRELDAAQSRVRSTLSRIEVVVDRAKAVDGVKSALERDDLEAAAGCIARYFDIEEEEQQTRSLSTGTTAAIAAVTSATSAAQEELTTQILIMNEWKSRVEAAVRTKTTAAIAARDHAAVSKYCRLFGPLQLQQEGMESLVNYLRSLISDRAQADYDALVDGYAAASPGSPALDYLSALTNLLRDVASAIDEHLELFRDAFGPEIALAAVYGVHAECDIRGTRILQRYTEERRLAKIAGQINMRARDDTAAEAAPIEPRKVEAFLNELLTLCTRGEEYTQYLLARMAEAAAPSALPPSRETSLRSGAMSTTLRELLSFYISLEEYYVEESVAKAIRIDEPVPGSLTSSVVEDAFFVLLSAGRRALATGRAPSAVSIFNQLNTVLSTLYRSALVRKLQGAATRLAGAGPVSPGGSPDSTVASVAALAYNNVDVSATYVEKLQQQLDDIASRVFHAAHDQDRLRLVLADLGKTAVDFRRIASQGTEQLCNAMMAPLKPLLDEFVDMDYEIRSETADDVATHGWSREVLMSFSRQFTWLQQFLTVSVYEKLVHAGVEKIVSRMEASVSQKRFTQLGGLQLERDVRSLLVGLSEMTSRSVREQFARLQQTATVLGVETAEEASELLGDAAVGWRLSSLDVRQALSQRVEFSPSAVAAVKLHV